MITTLIELSVLATSSFDVELEGVPTWLLLAGPAGAVGVYVWLYRFYRNVDKSHAFEQDTSIEAKPIGGGDEKIDTLRGLQRRKIQGANGDNHRAKVQRVS